LLGSLERAGAEGQVVELIKRLDRTQFQPALILETPTGKERVTGWLTDVRVLRPQPFQRSASFYRAYRGVASFTRLCRHLRDLQPAILHTFLPEASILGAGARLIGKVAIQVTSRRSLVEAYRPSDRLRAIADHYATKIADVAVGNCVAVSNELTDIDGVAPTRARTIYNGVDTATFSPSVNPELRAQLGWDGSNLVFGILANLHGYKRHRDLVAAAPRILRELPHARFLLVGDDRGALADVRALIQAEGIAGCVQVLPATAVPQSMLAAMDVYVCPSDTEGFSNSILEAMAAGLPVIATNAGGNAEAVEVGQNGYIVPCRNVEMIAAHAIELGKTPSMLKAFGQRSRQRAEQQFSLGQMVRAYQELYAELLNLRN
jgi:glycosyltransferase involved in cell wall biosynthesis